MCLAGQTNGCVASGVGETVAEALDALDALLASQAAQVLGAFDGGDG